MSGRTAYRVTFYRDEAGDAAADTFALSKPYLSATGAERCARKTLNSQWPIATVHKGTWYEPTVDRDWEWEDDEDARPVIIGSDWIDRGPLPPLLVTS